MLFSPICRLLPAFTCRLCGRLRSLLLRGQAASKDDTKDKTSGGDEEENQKGVPVTLSRVDVPHLASAVHNCPCHSLHDSHSSNGKGFMRPDMRPMMAGGVFA